MSVGPLVILSNFHSIRVSGRPTRKVEESGPQLFFLKLVRGKGGGESLKKIEKYDLRSPLVFTLFCREASVKFPHLELWLCKKNDKYEVCIQVYLLSSDKPKNSRKGQG